MIAHRAAKGSAARLFRCLYRQRSRTRACPDLPRLEGKTALVTGGMAGVGEFVSRGLAERGAAVVSLSRGVSKGTEMPPGAEAVKCDLADADSIVAAVNSLDGRTFDIVVCNSGIVSRVHEVTPDGIERTFAVNVLGHHLLYRLLIERGQLAGAARIVMTTGDAYVIAKHCKPFPQDYRPNLAYAGSKLGNLWQARELARRYPNLRAYAVHPGVVNSGFAGGDRQGVSHWLRSKLLITEGQGAQAALIAATQGLPNGSYWHNACGVMELPETDAALDARKSAALWEQMEVLIAPNL
ncbi:SDR family NAD(P)-dependent oxidoreductase [Leisingera sp. ANG-Vp]|uniref:SDR family NAD(P)-dependent oxidoreductase n=1 Tax=Leisingera sp. ANG-Vp TaxID=1577896 RepID=UPI0023AA190B|nr:SDR family NAD(P)-dependent oxidoreductase [Leisingera sp. ANG-Vp]